MLSFISVRIYNLQHVARKLYKRRNTPAGMPHAFYLRPFALHANNENRSPMSIWRTGHRRGVDEKGRDSESGEFGADRCETSSSDPDLPCTPTKICRFEGYEDTRVIAYQRREGGSAARNISGAVRSQRAVVT